MTRSTAGERRMISCALGLGDAAGNADHHFAAGALARSAFNSRMRPSSE